MKKNIFLYIIIYMVVIKDISATSFKNRFGFKTKKEALDILKVLNIHSTRGETLNDFQDRVEYFIRSHLRFIENIKKRQLALIDNESLGRDSIEHEYIETITHIYNSFEKKLLRQARIDEKKNKQDHKEKINTYSSYTKYLLDKIYFLNQLKRDPTTREIDTFERYYNPDNYTYNNRREIYLRLVRFFDNYEEEEKPNLNINNQILYANINVTIGLVFYDEEETEEVQKRRIERERKLNSNIPISENKTDTMNRRTVNIPKYRFDIPFEGIRDNIEMYVCQDDITLRAIIFLAIYNYLIGIPIIAWHLISIKLNERSERVNYLRQEMHSYKPTKIQNIINGIELNESDNDNCVINYMKKILPKELHKHFNEIHSTNEGITTESLYNWCVKYRVPLYAYNLKCKKIKSYNPDNRRHCKRLMYLVYNNHLYPIDKKEDLRRKKKQTTFTEIEYMENINNIFFKLLDDGEYIEPATLKYVMDKNNKCVIKSFIHNNILYNSNEDIVTSNILCESFNQLDALRPHNSRANIVDTLINAESKQNFNSILPFKTTRLSCLYYTGRVQNRPFVTLDFTKFYGNILKNFTTLPVVNFINDEIIAVNKLHSDPENYIYWITLNPDIDNLEITPCLPEAGMYSGKFLQQCINANFIIENKHFYVYRCIKCKQVPNDIGTVIKKIYDLVENNEIDEQFAKHAINRYIGNLIYSNQSSPSQEIITIGTHQECLCDDSTYVDKINDRFSISYKLNLKYNIGNKNLIHTDIIDYSRFYMTELIYELIKKNNLNKNDIIQIKNDAITFYIDKLTNFNVADYISDKKTYGLHDETHKFKKPPNAINADSHGYFGRYQNSLYMKNEINFNNISSFLSNECRHLYNCYAGAGKSHAIINQLIPNLIASGCSSNNYVVITPNHITRIDYERAGISNVIIHKHLYARTIPEATRIIIEEIGLFDTKMMGLIYYLAQQGCKLYAFGDYRQMPPIEKDNHVKISETFKKWLFKNTYESYTNNRNDFTTTYYDSLIESDDKQYLLSELRKYSTDNYEDADIIISYYNDTAAIYNDLILKRNKQTLTSIGTKIICQTNALRDYDIYNKHEFIIKNVNGNTITIIDSLSKEYEFNSSKIKRNFVPSYSRTVYGIQGLSIPKIYYCNPSKDFVNILAAEDIKIMQSKENNIVTGALAYTIISRIKTHKDTYDIFKIY